MIGLAWCFPEGLQSLNLCWSDNKSSVLHFPNVHYWCIFFHKFFPCHILIFYILFGYRKGKIDKLSLQTFTAVHFCQNVFVVSDHFYSPRPPLVNSKMGLSFTKRKGKRKKTHSYLATPGAGTVVWGSSFSISLVRNLQNLLVRYTKVV